jgi:hypothetical protein
MLATSQSTSGHVHVAQKLLINCRHKSDHEQNNLAGSPMSHVLANDDKLMGKKFAMTYESPPAASLLS